jgi:hypothetical protein
MGLRPGRWRRLRVLSQLDVVFDPELAAQPIAFVDTGPELFLLLPVRRRQGIGARQHWQAHLAHLPVPQP